MAYTSNPFIGKTRRLAVNDVLVRKQSHALVSRKYGVHRSTIGRWVRRAPQDRKTFIETLPSRPKSHPHQLSSGVVRRVIAVRKELKRCAPIVYQTLVNEGVSVSLSSVERILRRYNLTRTKKQLKPPYAKLERPLAENPGDLVQVDTIHCVKLDYSRFFIYAVIDICSRMAYAEFQPYISAKTSFTVIQNACKYFNFPIKMIQTDNGSEFSEDLYLQLRKIGILLRHTRVGRPNDNAHIERFNRTLQEECFNSKLPNEVHVKTTLKRYLNFYNSQRLHLSLQCQTPHQFVAKLEK